MNVLDTLKVKPIPKQKVGFSIEVPIKVTNKISDEKYDDILTALQTNGFIKILKPKKELLSSESIAIKEKTTKIRPRTIKEGEEKEKEEGEEKSKKERKTAIKGVADLDPGDWTNIQGNKSVHLLANAKTLFKAKISNYYMNNREIFINFINAKFLPYKKELMDNIENISCEGQQSENISLLVHQKLVRDYLNLYTPYRGLLLYHGLGSGKTCTSIAIAEGMKNAKKVIVMTPASLEENYLSELKKCGDSIYKKNQFWKWFSHSSLSPDEIKTLSAALSLPVEYIKKQKGAFLVDKSNPSSNYSTLDIAEKNKLNDQINEMIKTKYTFIHYNGLQRDSFLKMTKQGTVNLFDNSVVVIDEAHNFISRIVNKIDKENSDTNVNSQTGEKVKMSIFLSLQLYEMLLSAKNTRIVLLTGTPMINYPNEIAILFNILRGYIKTWKIPLKIKSSSISKEKLHSILIKNKSLDYLDYANGVLSITRNPYGFHNVKKDQEYVGMTSETKGDINTEPNEEISDEIFLKQIVSLLEENSINIAEDKKISVTLFKSLPDKLVPFMEWFIESDKKIKNAHIFKKRVMGLTSYFRSAQEKLLPVYDVEKNLKVIEVAMSDLQFNIYEESRIVERKEEERFRNKKKKGKQDNIFSEPSSTFRIFSRMFCNYVIPKRPRPINDEMGEDALIEDKEEEDSKIDDMVIDEETEYNPEEMAMEKVSDNTYKKRIQLAIHNIIKNGSEFLSKPGLETYSPKFLKILENIQNPKNIGLHLLYSQFRTLEGIGLFKLVLDYNGFTQFKIKKNAQDQWVLDMKEENIGKQTYALYTGTETREEKEAMRNIYNGDWDAQDLSPELVKYLKKVSKDNQLGQIIKVFMITASGSEGINLRNTRFVHIMEPYWHPVRIEQVIGRARRICSHKSLPEELRTVEVFIYLMKLSKEQLASDASIELRVKDLSKLEYPINPDDLSKGTNKRPFTSDQTLYEIGLIKEKISKQLLVNIKESSIDCATYADINSKEKLKCLQFGQPASDTFAFNPDIVLDNATVGEMDNKKVITWQAKNLTIKGVEYVYGNVNSESRIGNIYDKQSYLNAVKNPDIVPIIVGTINLLDPKNPKVNFI
jgi:hypothetical protein